MFGSAWPCRVAARMPWLRVVLLLCLALPGLTQDMDAENCLSCHASAGLAIQEPDGRLRDFRLDPAMWAGSVHGRLRCRQCHLDVEAVPHGPVARVDCTVRCHMVDPSTGQDFSHRGAGVALARSVHGKASKSVQPGCKDCHTDPRYWPAAPGDLQNLATGCLECHKDYVSIDQDLRHLTLHLSENRREHHRMGYEACVRCHASRDSLGGPSLVDGFLVSFHGRGFQLGDRRSPVCSDCHGHHQVLAAADSASTLHASRAEATCGTSGCHAGAAGGRAPKGSLHGRHGGGRETLLATIASGQAFLLMALLLGVPLWQVLEMRAQGRWRRHASEQSPLYRRTSAGERGAHLALALLFLALAASGVLLWLPEGALATLGDPTWLLVTRGLVHRVAALFFGLLLVGHVVWFLLVPRGRRHWRERMPGRADFTLLGRHLAWLVGRAPQPAPFPWQRPQDKLLALGFLVGGALLSISGLVLALRGEGRLFWVDLARTVHGPQALLALACVMGWHVWDQLAMPGRAGAHAGWLTGRKDRTRMELEHGGALAALDGGEAPAGWTVAEIVDDRPDAWELVRRIEGLRMLRWSGIALVAVSLALLGGSAWSLHRQRQDLQSHWTRPAELPADPWERLVVGSHSTAWKLDRFHDDGAFAAPSPAARRSECLLCHPPLPHQKDPASRAWLNMHGRTLACEACHAGEPGPWVWVSSEGGPSPKGPVPDALLTVAVDGRPLRHVVGAKDGAASPMPLAASEREARREEFHAGIQSLDRLRLTCDNCHAPEGVMPFAALGYTGSRLDHLRSEAKAASVTSYAAFHLPPQE